MSETRDSLLSSTSPSPNLDDLVPLSHVGRELVKSGLSSSPVPYGAIWRGVTSGAIPTEPTVGNREGVRRRNLPIVAKALRLTRESAAA